jgi:hypothetical protein
MSNEIGREMWVQFKVENLGIILHINHPYPVTIVIIRGNISVVCSHKKSQLARSSSANQVTQSTLRQPIISSERPSLLIIYSTSTLSTESRVNQRLQQTRNMKLHRVKHTDGFKTLY